MKYLFLILMLLPVTGCKTNCSQSVIVNAASNALYSKWQCSNQAALTSWLDGIASNVGVCSQPSPVASKQGVLAGTFCPLLVNYLQGQAAAQVPAAAGCVPALVGAQLAAAVQSACEAIPF